MRVRGGLCCRGMEGNGVGAEGAGREVMSLEERHDRVESC